MQQCQIYLELRAFASLTEASWLTDRISASEDVTSKRTTAPDFRRIFTGVSRTMSISPNCCVSVGRVLRFELGQAAATQILPLTMALFQGGRQPGRDSCRADAKAPPQASNVPVRVPLPAGAVPVTCAC